MCDMLVAILERALAIALIAGIALNFVNVVGRYLAGFTLTGVDEIEVFILIWIAFLGAAIISWHGLHLRMDLALHTCPAFIRACVAIIEMCVMISMTLFVAIQSVRYVSKLYALGAVSDIARVPIWVPHSAVFIGFGAMALFVVIRGTQSLTRLEPVRDTDPPESGPKL